MPDRAIRRLTKVVMSVARGYRSGTSRGGNLFHDLTSSIPRYRAEVILDVGAHVGESTVAFARWAPWAGIHSFEPCSDSFERLVAATKRFGNVHCGQMAMGSANGTARLAVHSSASDTNRLLQSGELAEEHEEVVLRTVADYCSEVGIERISLLKVDTEGSDLDVLKGAASMLDDQRIDLVQVEAGMNPENELHVPFSVLREYMEQRSYRLFALYEQVHEWPSGQIQLRRTNPVFISSLLIESAAKRRGAK